MSTIDELRGFLNKHKCRSSGDVHTIDPHGVWIHVAHIEGAWSALLAVAEAARTFPGIHCDTEDAIKWASKLRSALARLDGEVGNG